VTIASRLRSPAGLSVALAALALPLLVALLAGPLREVWTARPEPGTYDVSRMVLLYATLPRLAIAVLCGGALAASGAILQQVLRNPLASPTTLGIDAGARLALTLTTLLMPSLLVLGRDAVALAGSAASTLLVFALVRRRGFSSLALVLAGLVVSLYTGALSALLVLLRDRLLVGLFVWGSGSLSQQSWDPSIALAWRLALLAVPLALLVRPLSVLDLGEDGARALGLRVTRLRVGAVGLAVALSAFVTSAVGVIGFVGLVAPILARVSGARLFGERLIWSIVIGALLLLVTDAALQLAAGASSEFIPTGAVTAVIGSPILLLLLPRLRVSAPPSAFVPGGGAAPATHRPGVRVAVVLLVLLVAASVLVGRGPSGGWELALGATWDAVLTWRLPRAVASAAAGALLGVAGVILQRITGNPMASPEVLGVSAGAVLAVAITVFAVEGAAGATTTTAAAVGSAGVLGLILAFGSRTSFAPERVLLAGIALSALVDALIGVLSATGDPRALVLLGWMSGSTAGTSSGEALGVGLAAGALVVAALLTARWLAILPLGGPHARALGIPLSRSRLVLLLLAAAATAAATSVTGPLTFVGLMAPHMVLAAGIRRARPAVAMSALAGAGVMACADLLARTVAFPIQLPTGLVAALVGAPFLMGLLTRRS
jgi:ferric hydroxamate transport system permease protein